jgi:hypothetical protein
MAATSLPIRLVMVYGRNAREDNNSAGLILDPNPVASLAEPPRKPSDCWPCMAYMREVYLLP